MLAVLAIAVRPSSACTVYDLYSSGMASSLWHMIPAVALFADNGTFYVSPRPLSFTSLPYRFAPNRQRP